MEDIVLLICVILMPMVIASILNKKVKVCSKCNGTMKSLSYIGDGKGPAYDHTYYKCSKCGNVEQELE